MENLKIIPSDFPSTGAAASITASKDLSAKIKDNQRKCLPRTTPPPRPVKLPFELIEKNSDQMKQWLLERFASSTLNQCSHQPLPMMKRPADKKHVDPNATPSEVHTPNHWCEMIKKQLDVDVSFGVIEKVPSNTPTSWCHRAYPFSH